MMQFSRNQGIDYLRGLAITLVLGLHFFDFKNFVDHIDPAGVSFAYRLFGHGYFGVNIFFVISGFLIASTSVEGAPGGGLRVDAPRFYVRRATRILPLLLVTLLLGMLAIRFFGSSANGFDYLFRMQDGMFTVPFWASIFTFTFNWFRIFDGGETQGWFGLQWDLLWSLAVEEQFYLLFPWVIMAVATLPKARIAIIAIIAVSAILRAALIVDGVGWLPVLTNSLTCFDALAIGVGVALMPTWSRRASWIAGVAGGVGLAVTYLCGFHPLLGLPTLGLALSTGLLIQASRHPWKDLLPTIPFHYISDFGRLSYGIYLLHPLTFFMVAPFALKFGKYPGLLIVMAATYLVAKCSYRFFERPIERHLRTVCYAALVRRETPDSDPLPSALDGDRRH